MPDDETAETLEALARHVRASRQAAGMSVEVAAGAAGISPVTWARIEKGLVAHDLTYIKIERALRWGPGSVKAVMTGGEPLPRNPSATGNSLAKVAMRKIGALRKMSGDGDDDLVLATIWDIVDTYERQLAQVARMTGEPE